ncbi:dirigent protein 4-like [Durio zibethinus]|uniref:Dirigent protein n=1 Tax=Durio zibethinus TaxID=66656 RepID=A0A6P5XEU2_DURZI|nr:dirigent protein 4-like [Durio zibethinus]
MDRSLILAWFLVLCAAMAPAFCQGYYSNTVPYVPTPAKVTHLHFFLHDTLSGKNPSAVKVARPNITTAFSGTPTPFGSVFAVDDPLTVGPDLTSEVVGNAQGIWVSTGQDVLTLVVYLDFGFTRGEFNGSSFSVFSRNPITKTEREVAVVGGRGKFRMATGFAHLRTYFLNSTSSDAIVEYNVTLIHH